MSAVSSVLSILSLLGKLLQRWDRRRHEQKKQEEYDAVERDPAGEFMARFKRVRSDKQDSASGSASGTGKRHGE
ncbi:MAG: hypothetical protein ACNI27_07340 [Desulfovibrio sp.]